MKHPIPLWVFLAALFAATGLHAEVQTIVKQHSSVAPKTLDWTMQVPPFSIEHQARLSLECRIDFKKIAGSNPWIIVSVNDNVLTKADLLNKSNDFKLSGGMDLQWCNSGNRWRVLYSPDFKLAIDNRTDAYGVAAKDEPYRYVWDITQHVRPGNNKLRIVLLQVLAKPSTLVLRNVQVEAGKAIEPKSIDIVTPAPTGPVPTHVATGKRRLPIMVSVSAPPGFGVHVGDRHFQIDTRVSLPGGKWQELDYTRRGEFMRIVLKSGKSEASQWKAGDCAIKRKISVRDDHVQVADTFTNTGNKLLGVIVEHQVSYKSKPEKIVLCGKPAFGESATVDIAEHPSSFVQWKDFGLGLVAEDDIFRVHIQAFTQPGRFGIADRSLGIMPGKSVTLEWSVYPEPKGDYWSFVNAVRRNWDVNYAIPGPFVFASHYGGKPAEWYADWVRKRDLKIVVGSIAKYPDGKYSHGTGILHNPRWIKNQRDWTQKLRKAAPDVLVTAYMHAFCSTEPDSETKYHDSRLIDAKGEHVHYPYRYPLPLYVPTRDNSYGKALWGFVNCLMDDIGVNGIYWDEMSYSVRQYAFQLPWDGYSVGIDPRTHEITSKRTSVPLLTQPLRLDMVKYIRGKGVFLMANGQAKTRTMMRQKIVRFVETNTYSALTQTHLGCPIGLGNHHSEKTQADSARNVRELLKYGAAYHEHIYWREPAAWNFTSVMYPLTPVEIGPGFILGAERIHTTVSGRFGWPDGAAADVYVVDESGAQVKQPAMREIRDKGKRLYELRMPSDHFAILVKRK